MKGRNDTFRKWMAENHPGALLLEPDHCDEAILGVCGDRVVYGYDELVESYAREFRGDAESDEDAYQMGVDWVEFNTLRSLSYVGAMAPVVAIYDAESEYLVDSADMAEDGASELEFDRGCPGLEES